MITSLTAHVTRIAVGDCRDGILFYSYQEVSCSCHLCFILSFYFYFTEICLLHFPQGFMILPFFSKSKKQPLIDKMEREWLKSYKIHLLVDLYMPS